MALGLLFVSLSAGLIELIMSSISSGWVYSLVDLHWEQHPAGNQICITFCFCCF